MGKVVLDMSMSLDGFIADSNGNDAGLNNWVFTGSIPITAGGMTFQLVSEASAEVFREFVDNVGAAVFGKRTFEAIGGTAPFQLPSFVLTHTPHPPETKDGATITFVTDGIESALAQARDAANGKDVYIFGGGEVAQQYVRAGLIDEIQINFASKLLGGGVRLFGDLDGKPVDLERIRTVQSPGVTHIKYRVVK
jgi:dihydrofolate reductase